MVEVNKKGCLAFLDMLIHRRDDGSLRKGVYHKPTHTNICLHKHSHHNPAQKSSKMHMLVHKDRVVIDPEHLEEEMAVLQQVFLQNISQ